MSKLEKIVEDMIEEMVEQCPRSYCDDCEYKCFCTGDTREEQLKLTTTQILTELKED